MSALTVGLALAKFVPDVVGIFAGEKKGDAAQKVLGIAEKLTGKSGDGAVQAIERDPDLALQFQKLVYAEKHELERMFLADVAGARDMSTKSDRMGELSSKIADKIMTFNLPFVFALIIAQCLVMVFLEDKVQMLALISNAIGFVINSLLNERQQVTGFLFGSSAGSKMKTKINEKKKP